jgi:hypothetical protein
MPKHTNIEVLRRWQAIDLALARGQLVVSDIAREFRVDKRTVYRDLEAFADLGQEIEMRSINLRTTCLKWKRTGRYEYTEHNHSYPPGQRPIFTATEDALS